jgi:hypothetical protein
MAIVLGITVFTGGLCFLAGQGIRRACKLEREAQVAERSPEDIGELPDTVPSEWVQAYRAETKG